MKTSEILGAGRDKIARGWCQHDAILGEGSTAQYCAVGALIHPRSLENRALVTLAVRLLDDKAMELGFLGIVLFNDDLKTTQQDVLDLYDKTIAGLEERGE